MTQMITEAEADQSRRPSSLRDSIRFATEHSLRDTDMSVFWQRTEQTLKVSGWLNIVCHPVEFMQRQREASDVRPIFYKGRHRRRLWN